MSISKTPAAFIPHALTRRSLLGVAAAAGTVGVLSACGGGAKDGKTTAPGQGANLKDLYDINAHEVSELKQGGTLRLPVGSMGPDFNPRTTSGNMTDTQTIMSTIHDAGLWTLDFDGTTTLRKEYAQSFTPGKEGEKVIVKIVLNPQAKFNDGTPVDVKALQTTWKTQQKADGEYNIVASDIYGYVESVEAEEDNFHVKVTFSKPFYPLNALFTFILHPALEDPKVFNEGFVDNLHPEWGCGPFTIKDGGFNSSEKTITVVPNDKWWGDKPVLEKIIFRQMDEPAKKAAFKNDEIDAAAAGTASAYSEFKAVAGTELHKGVRLHVSGIDVNPRRVKDAAVRKAIFYGLDREALAKIRYQGLPYEEEIPGSMLHMPFSEYYQDAFPKVEGSPKDAIKKVLEDAGYTKDGEFYAKDGQQIHYKIVIFGDDPVDKGMAQTFTRNMKEAGLNIEVDQHPEGDFGRVLGNWEYDITFAGYEANNPDATVATQQFFHSSNSDGIGSPEIDAMIEEMLLIEDDKERNLKCDEIEKKHTAELAFLGCAANGPNYVFTKKGLANYGAFLFKTIDWTKVGWVK